MHEFVWVCFNCLESGETVRRPTRASYYELQARSALKTMGYSFREEYAEITPYRFDFAVPALGLLLEIDSKSRHERSRYHKIRDNKKDRVAQERGWEVARIKPPEVDDIKWLVRQVVLSREEAIGRGAP